MSTEDFFHHGERVAVLTAQPLDRLLDYRAPEGGCFRGAYVEVPLGPRKVLGVIWGRGAGDFDSAKLRSVIRVLDVAPMREEMRSFLGKAADYTLTPMHAMLRLATRAPGLSDPPSMRKILRLGEAQPDRMTEARAKVLAVMEEFGGQAFTSKELADLAGVTGSVVKGLVKQGALREEETPRDLPYPHLDPELPGKDLTADQATAAAALAEGVQSGAYGTTLLKGVTGSGKTEVYLEAVAACLRKGRQALVLLPEIALTAEFLKRVEQRFGATPAEWHSGATMTERRRVWRMVGQGNAQLVIGARSALFLPFRDLGLIIVDEEHDTSYKQEDGVLYNARDMAVLRAALCSAQVVLASATPSLETWANAEAGKYKRLDLTSRFGTAVLPEMKALDMRAEELLPSTWISPSLKFAMKKRLEAGEQSLLFLNRRGFAPVTICRACGAQVACDHCDARMVEHRFQKRLMCHQCGETKPVPEACPSCQVEGKMAPVGPGIERLGEEAAALFPEARIAVLSSDLFGSARALKARIEEIAAGEADIILGTQLVAKGHNFPLLTLVGVIDADLGLQGSDLRAGERTFQLMRQVAGRAGRAERPGRALVQTYAPDNPAMMALADNNRDGFLQIERDVRAELGLPPFGRLAAMILSAPSAQMVDEAAQDIIRNAPNGEGIEVFGPAPAPITVLRGRHRRRFLVKSPKNIDLSAYMAAWTARLKLPNPVRMSVDIDPYSFL